MNTLPQWLSGGDLRSDGPATEVAEIILDHEDLFPDLLEGLDQSDLVIRARTADAMEKIARRKPDLLIPHLPKLFLIAKDDNPIMVNMHLAMLFGHILACDVDVIQIYSILFYLLTDKSVFTRSWAMVSLCILARKYPQFKDQIVELIAPLKTDPSVAIRSKAAMALRILLEDDAVFPRGWVKSLHLQDI